MTITSERGLPSWVLAAVFVSAVAVNASDYSFLVPQQHVRIETHQAIVEGRAAAPHASRVLVPILLEPPIRLLATVMPPAKAVTRTYAAYHLLALALLLAVLFRYLREWFSVEQSLAGALLVGSTIRIVLRPGEYWDLSSIPESSVFAPASLLEPTLVALGLVLILDNRRWLLGGLIAIAALNSEAMFLLPALFLVTRPFTRDRLVAAVGYLTIGIAVTIAVRLATGTPMLPSVGGDVLNASLRNLPSLAVNLALFLGPVWLLIPVGWQRTPAFARSAFLALPLYLIAIGLFGYWWDVRNLMPLYPLLLPPALAALFVPRGVTRSSGLTAV
jgi:hypothetical protein